MEVSLLGDRVLKEYVRHWLGGCRQRYMLHAMDTMEESYYHTTKLSYNWENSEEWWRHGVETYA